MEKAVRSAKFSQSRFGSKSSFEKVFHILVFSPANTAVPNDARNLLTLNKSYK